MYIQKFFYLTIQGDALDLDEAQQLIKLPCKIFHKDEIVFTKINGRELPHTPQKTNRWLYRVEDLSEISSEEFLYSQLKILNEHIEEIKPYITRGMAMLELTLYADNDTDFEFTVEHIELLHRLGLGISISFC